MSFAGKLLILFCLPLWLFGAEERPWSRRELELYPAFSYALQNYQAIKSSADTSHKAATNHYATLGISASYFPWMGEIETDAAKRESHGWGYETARFTFRRQFMNDIMGDPVSLTLGLKALFVTHYALHDPGRFYHGKQGAELLLSVGREWACEDFWRWRFWGLGAFGTATQGSPWVRFSLNGEYNVWDLYAFDLFVEALGGLGNHSFHHHHFHGYGMVRHRSLDTGLRLHYTSELGFLLEGNYTYRLYAQNCPEKMQQLQLIFTYPFGL